MLKCIISLEYYFERIVHLQFSIILGIIIIAMILQHVNMNFFQLEIIHNPFWNHKFEIKPSSS